ncbi:MAG: TonB-dependent receptor [Flavipsychrobacter sp.]
MRLNQKYLLTSLLAVTAVGVHAQTKNEDTSTLFKQQELQPIEVRSLRATSNSPFAKTELNKEDIQKANNGQDVPYLLQYTPSTVVTSDAGAGVGYTGLRVRGTDGTRINVTLNGIPVNDAESQGTFFVNFTDIASSTGSIQLQRGVGTSTNGSGAFGATMSISNLEQFEKAGAEIINSIGSFNTRRHTLRAGTGLLKSGLSFDVRLSKISSDGYIDRSASDMKSLQFIAGWQASDKTSLRFMVMTGKEKTQQAWNGVPQDSLSTNRTYNELGVKADGSYYDNQTDNYQQDYYQLFLDHKFSKHLTGHVAGFLTRGKGYYEEYRLGQSYSKYGLPDFITAKNDTITSTDLIRQLWLDNYYYGGVFSLLYDKKNTQLTFGGGWNRYEGDHYGHITWAMNNVPNNYRWYLNNAQKNDANVYAKAQHTIKDKLILFADLQYRNVQYDISGFRDNPTLSPSVSYNFFNPKAGVSYLLRNDMIQKQRFYASIAVANKEPNRNDFEAGVKTLPKAEQLYDIEAGYELNRSKWNVSANYFYMMYKDQLVLTGQINDVGAYTRTNVANSYRMGIELQGAVLAKSWLKLFANATLSQNKIQNFIEYYDNYDDPSGNQVAIAHSNTDIAFSPNFITAGGVTFMPLKRVLKKQSLELDLLSRYIGKQYLDNTSNDDRSVGSYGLLDARVRYTIRTSVIRELGLNLMLNNILDNKYESNGYTYSYRYGGANTTVNYYYPQAGFNWLLGVSMKF